MPIEIRQSSARQALSELSMELEVPEFLLQCLEEVCNTESPGKLLGLIVGQYSALLQANVSNGQPDWNVSSGADFGSKILDVVIRLWKQLPEAKGSLLRLLDLLQVRSKHVTTDQQCRELETIGTEILQSVQADCNWTVAVSFVSWFPDICNPDLFFDEFRQRGWKKPAIALVERLGLKKPLGKLREELRRETIEVAAKSEGKEIKAIALCERKGKANLRPVLVYRLLEEGKLELAQELMFAWKLNVKERRSHLRAAKKRSEKFFQLPKQVSVQMISSPGELDGLALQLTFGSSCVGLDTESSYRGKTVLLQVATETEAFLIDLLAIKKKEVQNFVARLMADPLIVKLGFGASELREMQRLGAKSVAKFFDMQQLGAQLRLDSSNQQMSLSRLSEELLGKPLNKEIRASRFDQRPLHPAQKRYATLDAWILVKMWNLPRVQKIASCKPGKSGA